MGFSKYIKSIPVKTEHALCHMLNKSIVELESKKQKILPERFFFWGIISNFYIYFFGENHFYINQKS